MPLFDSRLKIHPFTGPPTTVLPSLGSARSGVSPGSSVQVDTHVSRGVRRGVRGVWPVASYMLRIVLPSPLPSRVRPGSRVDRRSYLCAAAARSSGLSLGVSRHNPHPPRCILHAHIILVHTPRRAIVQVHGDPCSGSRTARRQGEGGAPGGAHTD
jgi:hypothetical protein